MTEPTSDLVIYAGCFVKLWHIPRAETVLDQHVHAHPHLSLIVAGRVRVFCAGASLGEFVAPALVKVEANRLHHFVALTDDVCIACIHAVGTADPISED